MSTINLHVKHASKVHDVDVPSESAGSVLKQRLEELTGVPVAKQKVMVKGKQLQNDVALSTLGLKNGQTLFMLGTAPKNAPPAASDATDSAAAPASSTNNDDIMMDDEDEESEEKLPVGLVNVGNTCYANSTLQALHTVPELNESLQKYQGNDLLLRSWAQLIPKFGFEFPYNTDAPIPTGFMSSLRTRMPQFAERGEGGIFKQQDAEELYTQLMSQLHSELNNVVDCFDGRFKVTKSNDSQSVSEENFTKLMCHISVKTNFLKDGLRQSLVDEVETREGSGEHHTITKQITKMPKYLIVQFVRFFWRRDTKVNSKILRKVTFPTNLDIGDLCTEDLQSRMAPAREAYRELELAIEEGKRAERRARFRKVDAVPDDPADTNADQVASAKRRAAENDVEEGVKEKAKVESLKQQFRNKIDPDLQADPTCSPHGLYDLQAIITHQGMSADSGHYQCFTRNPHKQNSWWRFNDDRVSEVDDNRIAQLAGGGASDSALILLYKSSEY